MRDIWKERHQISSVLPVSIISWKRLKIALLTTMSFPDNWAISPERKAFTHLGTYQQITTQAIIDKLSMYSTFKL